MNPIKTRLFIFKPIHFVLIAAFWLSGQTAVFAQLQVEVIATERILDGGYSYRYKFDVKNNSDNKSISIFSVLYGGSKSVAHLEPRSWTYEAIEITDDSGNILLQQINWKAPGGLEISPGEAVSFQFAIPGRTQGIDWQAGSSDSSISGVVTFPHDLPIELRAQIDLAQGINIISLPLRPVPPITASQLATELDSTIVVQAVEGQFQAYLPAGPIGEDFQLEAGKGFIINLLEAKTYSLIGPPWGIPVPAAPRVNTPSAPWAFVVAGRLDGNLTGRHLRIINRRTNTHVTAHISPSGKFTAAFVDMRQQPVVAPGDELLIQLMSDDGVVLGTERRQVHPLDLERAYLLTHISTRPSQTQLLQNYPNPFNPETWLPYQLSGDGTVTISIYDIKGAVVRRLDLGHRAAGYYVSRSRAAYWDGRNHAGERVSSGVYFYQISAGDFSAVRRMVILK